MFGNDDHDLRPLLQHDGQKEEPEQTLWVVMRYKPGSHYLEQGDTGDAINLSVMRG